jgi:hypothetical protein
MRFAIVLVVLGGCRRDADPPPPSPPPPVPVRAPAATGAQLDPPLAPGEGTMAIERTSEAAVRIRVAAGRGYHMNPDYPWKLVLEATPGVGLAKTTLRGRDAAVRDERELAIEIPFRRTDAGAQAIRGRLQLAVCERERCLPRSQPIDIAID